jgi:hypothetical protein
MDRPAPQPRSPSTFRSGQRFGVQPPRTRCTCFYQKNSNLAREAVGQERRVGRRRRWQNVWRIATLLPDLGLTFVL